MQLLQIMPSSGKGGAEVLFERTVNAFSSRGIKQHLILRKNASYDFRHILDVETSSLPFLNKYDVYTKYAIGKKTSQLNPAIVLSWLRRGNQMTKGSKRKTRLHIGRLDGYYKMADFLHNDFLIAHTPSIKQHIIHAGYPEKNVKVIPNFLEEPGAKTQVPYLKPIGKQLIVCWGRFIAKKGFATVIRALALDNNFHLWLIGDGSETAHFLKLMHQLGVAERVTLIPWQNDISPYLYAADVLVVPSVHEPFGNVVIEAWAHRKTLICSNSEGPSWLVTHGYNGLLFEKGCADSLAKQLSSVKVNSSQSMRLARNGYTTFKNYYHVDVVIPGLIDWFFEIYNRRFS